MGHQYPKTCAVCTRGFIPRNKTGKYCSETCALNVKNPPRYKYCHFCKELKLFGKHRTHYCSKECAVESKKRKYQGQFNPVKMPRSTVFLPGHKTERIWPIDFLHARGNEAKRNLKDMFGSMFRVNV